MGCKCLAKLDNIIPNYRIISTLKKEGSCIYETLVTFYPINKRLIQKRLLVYSSEHSKYM